MSTEIFERNIKAYLTPSLVAIIGFMLKSEYADIKSQLSELQKNNVIKSEMLIEIREKVRNNEIRLTTLEGKTGFSLQKTPAKKEDEYTLKNALTTN